MTNGSLANALRVALSDAAGEVLNAWGAARGCLPLFWFVPVPGFDSTCDTPRPVGGARLPGERVTVLGGHAGARHTEDEAVVVVRAWAEAFGLVASPNAPAHTIAYFGEIDDVLVELWAVTDRAGFYRRDEG